MVIGNIFGVKMTKYKIVKRQGVYERKTKYVVQWLCLFFWIDVRALSENILEFDSIKEAEESIKHWKLQDSTDEVQKGIK